MPGYGTGVPLAFSCLAWRNRLNWRDKSGRDDHQVTRTGLTRPARNQGRLHPRTLSTSHQYRCTCGYVGWSYHGGVLDCPVDAL